MANQNKRCADRNPIIVLFNELIQFLNGFLDSGSSPE